MGNDQDMTPPGNTVEGFAGAVLTGSAAEARPVSGCGCVTCRATVAGESRFTRPTGLDVRGVLLLDGTPDPAPVATAPERTARERTAREPVRLATRARPGARMPQVGERVEVAGLRVVGLPAGDDHGRPDPNRVVLVIADGSHLLLWAPDTGPLPGPTLESLGAAGLTAAVLDAGKPLVAERLGHHLARLRSVDALAPGCVVVAANLTHDGPPPHRLAAVAAAWGVAVLNDGAPLADAPRPAPDALRLPRRTLVLGAAASGKSSVAESLLAAEPAVVYLATGPAPGPDDLEWAARVGAHRARRPDWWTTMESDDLAASLARPGAPLLVDSLGTWAADMLDRSGCWSDAPGWQERCAEEVDTVVAAWRGAARDVVAVGEEVGWGVVPDTPSGRRFRDVLGGLTQRLAAESERVLLVVAGRVVDLDAGGGA